MKVLVGSDSTWKVERRVGIYVPNVARVAVRNEGHAVVLFIGQARVELRTPEAHKMGFALIRCADSCIDENTLDFVVLTVNGSEIHIEAAPARQLAGALLRKADLVDRFQNENKLRIVK